MKVLYSPTTTRPAAPACATGARPGENGLAMPVNLPIAAWLAKRTPAQVDAEAVSLAKSRGATLHLERSWMAPNGLTSEYRPPECFVARVEVQGGAEDREEALRVLTPLLTPAPQQVIAG